MHPPSYSASAKQRWPLPHERPCLPPTPVWWCSAPPATRCTAAAVSPGLVRDQRSYVLGAVRDPALTSALLGLFLDPERTLDPVFTTAAGTTLLAAANGRRTHEALSAGKQMEQATTTRAAAVAVLSKHGRWELPAIGKAPAAPLLVSEVRREVTHQAVSGPHFPDVNNVPMHRWTCAMRRHTRTRAPTCLRCMCMRTPVSLCVADAAEHHPIIYITINCRYIRRLRPRCTLLYQWHRQKVWTLRTTLTPGVDWQVRAGRRANQCCALASNRSALTCVAHLRRRLRSWPSNQQPSVQTCFHWRAR